MLASEGFTNAKPIAKKVTSLFDLMMQQFSKQDHYDWGLRNIRSVLMAAGAMKRADLQANEEMIALRAMRDMTAPKLTKDDLELFQALMSDLEDEDEP